MQLVYIPKDPKEGEKDSIITQKEALVKISNAYGKDILESLDILEDLRKGKTKVIPLQFGSIEIRAEV